MNKIQAEEKRLILTIALKQELMKIDPSQYVPIDECYIKLDDTKKACPSYIPTNKFYFDIVENGRPSRIYFVKCNDVLNTIIMKNNLIHYDWYKL